jgi:diguanylate cyclase (GGDEF)-like protein/PAS domain S-box-containing protein
MSARTENWQSGPSGTPLPSARILVVDDRPTSRAVVKGVLSSSAYVVEEADSGAKALQLIEEQGYDLVILDIVMPDMDGLEVLRNIRAQYSESELPVIIATVKHCSTDMVEALKCGANDYVTKPIDYPLLFTRIERRVAAKRSEDAARSMRQSLEDTVEAHSAELLRVNDVLRHEVSERILAEKATLAREEQFRDFTEVAADWFWEMDSKLRYTYVSERFETICGWSLPQIIGRTRRQIFGDRAQDQQLWESHFEDLDLRRPFEGFEYLWERPDRTTRMLRISGKPLFDADGYFVGYRGAARDVTEAHNLSEELLYRSSHDTLTGLVNREEFEHRLRRALESTRLRNVLRAVGARKTEHVLCYLDLDQFKIINDTCGHVAGDELLRQLGKLLTDQIRRRDTVARLGGDEFGILMEHCTLDQAHRVAENIRREIGEYRFMWEDKLYGIGVSIGLASLNEFTDSITSAMKDADDACNAAKDQGRNRIHIYREDDATIAKWHGDLQWVDRINRALEENRFRLYFQPIVPVLERNEGAHYELLVRMSDEQGAIVSPSAFLPTAERYNLATKIDRWVINESFGWLHRHPDHLAELFRCSINLSGQSLSDDTFLDFVTSQFRRHDLPPTKICFEVTETAAIDNLVGATRVIKALKSLGCMFSLDDFGSGLSSFAYLKNLPVDILKIDGMFVRDIVDDPIELAMVRSINEIGHVMGKQTVAEFVEDEAILQKLRETGVDYVQGYVLGAPRPIDEVWAPASSDRMDS